MNHQKTLLEKLGFLDHDKTMPDHDLFCQYLTRAEVLQKLIRHISPPKSKSYVHDKSLSESKEILGACEIQTSWNREPVGVIAQKVKEKIQLSDCRNRWEIRARRRECPISKGEMQYKTTIGFMDLYVEYQHINEWDWHLHTAKRTKGTLEVSSRRYPVIIEVKTKLHVGDFLRQMNLYREYVKGKAVLGMTSPISPLDRAAVEAENILVIQAGPDFERWKSSVSTLPKKTEVLQL